MSTQFATVEEAVRHKLAQSLGGKRGMFEAAAPTLLFTAVWLLSKDLTWALTASLVLAVGLLFARIVQRSTTQYCWNALFGIGLGWLFVYLAARRGGDANEQALAFFLPGIIWSSVYSLLCILSCLTRWPMAGFMLGAVDPDDPFGWRRDPQVVKLCINLTWMLTLPGMIGVILQGPVWLAGSTGWIGSGAAVALLGTLRFVIGWPLRFGALAGVTWLLARNHTPIQPVSEAAS